MVSNTFTAQAAGPETWVVGTTGDVQYMNVTDYNLTPVKTISGSGYLQLVFGFFSKRNGVDEPTWYPPVKVTVKIQDATTGEVYEDFVFYEGNGDMFTVSCYLRSGTRIQIYTDISSQYNSPGVYRKAGLSYYYILAPR